MARIKWGIIGAGDIVRRRVGPAINELENCELYAVARADTAKAEDFAREFGAKKWFADWREMMADDAVEAIYIATPVYLHAEQTIAAAEAGKHVPCEKPMAMDVTECERMIAACEANNVKLGVAYYRRFYPILERVREILASGDIGRAVVAQINAFEYVPLTADQDRGWFVDPTLSGGGPMMDFGCHRIEVLTDLFGGVVRQSSLTTKAIFDRDVEDTASISMELESGIFGSVTVTHGAAEPQDTLSIFGTLGSIHIPKLSSSELGLRTKAGTTHESHPPHANVHLPLIDEFADAIQSEREPRVHGETGRMIAEIMDMIYGRTKAA